MSRKYRQRGYQDEEPREARRQGSPGRARPDGPHGRGLGKPTATVFRCARCGAEQPRADNVALGGTCNGCGSDLHTCTNCRHFDTGATNECRAGIVERVSKKSTRNQCGLFEPKAAQESSDEGPDPTDARAEFDALFDF